MFAPRQILKNVVTLEKLPRVRNGSMRVKSPMASSARMLTTKFSFRASSCRQPHSRVFHSSTSSFRKTYIDPESKAKIPPSGPQPGGNDPNEVFTDMNVLAGSPPPASAIEVVYEDGFLLNNGMRLRSNDGIIIIHGEAFKWLTKHSAKVKNGFLELDEDAWGVLDVVVPKPELLVFGTGGRTLPIAPETKKHLHRLGIRIDSMDTNNAASSYNMLATERPGQIIAAAMLPLSFP